MPSPTQLSMSSYRSPDDASAPSSSARRRRTAAVLAGLTSGAILAMSSSSSSIGGNLRLNGRTQARRQMSIALPDGGCLVTPASVPRPPVTPVYAASYPGSGAKMTWNLIEALTGLVTGDEYGFSRDGSNVVSLKTHYPHGDGIPPKDDIAVTGQPMKRGFILMRNPRYAIPSLHSFVYEVTNDLPAHSTRAPMDEWRKWRDSNVPNQIKAWAKSIEYWMDRLTPDNRILITYESMTDDATGPATAQRLVDFLARDPNVNAIDAGSVECVWKAVVKYHETPHLPSLAHGGLGVPNQNAEEGRMLRRMPAGEILAGAADQSPPPVTSQQVAPELVDAARKLAGPTAQAQPGQAQAQAPPAQAQPPQAQAQAQAQAPPAQAQPPQAQAQPVQAQAPLAQAQAQSGQAQALPAQAQSPQPQAQAQAQAQITQSQAPASALTVQVQAQQQSPAAANAASSMYPEAKAQAPLQATQAQQQPQVAATASSSMKPQAQGQAQQPQPAAKAEPFSMYTQYAEEKKQAQQQPHPPLGAPASSSGMYPEAKAQAQAAPAATAAVAAPHQGFAVAQPGVPARRLQEAIDGAVMDAVQEAYAAARKMDSTRGGHHAVSSMAADRGPLSEANKQRADAALQGMVAAPPQQAPPAAGVSPPPRELAQAPSQPLFQAPVQPVQVQPQAMVAPQAPVEPSLQSSPQAASMEAQTERVLARNLAISSDAATPQLKASHPVPAVAAQQPQQQSAAAPALPRQQQHLQQQQQPQVRPAQQERELSEGVSAQKAIEFARRDQRRAKEALVLARKEEAATGEKSTLGTQAAGEDDPDARHKADNHPALPSSFRSGPVTKPYTKVQIQLMVEVMEALQAKYKNDEQLVRVLDGYLKDVKSMPGE